MNYVISGADGKAYGPVSAETIRQWVAEGRLGPQTQATRDGEAASAPLASFPEFAGLFPTAAGPASAPLPVAAPPPVQAMPASYAAAPATSSLAVASLVLGVLALTCGLTCIPAIICGHLARARIAAARGALGGAGMALAGLILGYVFLVVCAVAILAIVAGMLLPALGGARDKARQLNCAGNLKQIGLACKMYAADYSEEFPPNFKTLVTAKYLDAYKIYVCPSTSHTAGSSPGDVENPAHCDYLYFGGGHTERDIDQKAVLACDRPGNHRRLFNVVFGDGHSESLRGDSLEAALRTRGLSLPPGAAAER